jgi:hypothetical protein
VGVHKTLQEIAGRLLATASKRAATAPQSSLLLLPCLLLWVFLFDKQA